MQRVGRARSPSTTRVRPCVRPRAAFPREPAFALIKPEVVSTNRKEELLRELEARGYTVAAERTEQLSEALALTLFPKADQHTLTLLTSNPSCLVALEKPFAIADLIGALGPPNPAVAAEVAPDSLRGKFGTDEVKNAIDVSMSAEEAQQQLTAAFGERDFVRAPDERSVAILLPDAVGKLEVAVATLRRNGFRVLATKQTPLSADTATALLSGLNQDLIEYAQSGLSTAICVTRPHAVRALRSIVGPAGAAVVSTLSAALGFDNVGEDRSPAICPDAVEVADASCRELFPELYQMQTTLAIIKPDAVGAGVTEQIVQAAVDRGFAVRARTSLQLPKFKAEEFYAEHKGKPFLPNLVGFMSSGPCVALALARPGAIAEWRALMGPTRTAAAREEAPGCLRALYGTNNTLNATHGSDSEESAKREVKFFFPALSVEPLPRAEQVAIAIKEQLEPTLIGALTELCKAKPEEPVRWLGNYLLTHNPNKPKVAQVVIQKAVPQPPPKKAVPDLKVRARLTGQRRQRRRERARAPARPHALRACLAELALPSRPRPPGRARAIARGAAQVINGLREYFDSLDVNKSGSLSLSEFRAARVGQLGITLPDIDLVKADLFVQLDANADDRVTWAEFRAGLLERAADLCFDSRVSLYRKLFGEGQYAGARTPAELVSSLQANTVRERAARAGGRARTACPDHGRALPRPRRAQAILKALFGEDLPALVDVFKALDKDGSGSVTWDEFVERVEGAFRPRAPIAHRERIKKRAPPPLEAPPSAPPPPAF